MNTPTRQPANRYGRGIKCRAAVVALGLAVSLLLAGCAGGHTGGRPLARTSRTAVPGPDGEPTGAAPTTSSATATTATRATASEPAQRPGQPAKPGATCTVRADLTPACGVLWGVAPGAYTDLPASRALAQFEEKTGRGSDILHAYHRADELFPTPDEIAASKAGGRSRLLLENWKVGFGSTWAAVAAGKHDERIDRLADYLKKNYRERFFLAIHHEPENDVNPRAGSGMTAQDYAAMYAHTVKRLRAAGVNNAVFVMIYMAYEPWCVQPWFNQLWPGDDVVDWVGFDPYLHARPGNYGFGDFAYLVDRSSDRQRWPGFYSWVTRTHGNKPLMLAEWGVFEYPSEPSRKAWVFSTVAEQLRRYPAIKALVYFDSPRSPKGDTRPDSSGAALAEYRRLADSTTFAVHLG
jgi:hypothetical protein